MKPIQYKIQKFDPNKIEWSESEVLEGPVELMKEACRVAKCECRRPENGEFYFSDSNRFARSLGNLSNKRLVIPAESYSSCPHCQDLKPGQKPPQFYYEYKGQWGCDKCGRPESEWTYAPEPEWGGIGSGIM